MKIWKTKSFHRWQKKSAISDQQLYSTISEMQGGLIDADLGNGVYKKRIARKGKGKRSGYRTLLATNKDSKWFFIYGFAKNERENIEQQELESLKKLARTLLTLSSLAVEKATHNGELTEITHEK